MSVRVASSLLDALDERVVVADGAMGTMLQSWPLTVDDFAGLEGCSEILNVGPGRVGSWSKRIVIGEAVAPTVCDNSETTRERLELRLPGAVISHSSVEKNYRSAASLLDVTQAYAVDMCPHRFNCRSACALEEHRESY